MAPPRVSVRKALFFALNLASTLLTLFTGLQENPLVVFVTGRYDLLRSRFLDGTINYNLAREDTYNISMFPDLKHVGNNYRFFTSPRRSFDNMGSNQNLCQHVGAINPGFTGRFVVVRYDDFWGKGPRRTQMFVHSISAPNCKVLNLKTAWINSSCIPDNNNSVSSCHDYILRDFDNLTTFLPVQRTLSSVPSQAFLKCHGRQPVQFSYVLDSMLFQTYWAGGSGHIEIQTCNCLALPLTRSKNWEWGLFRVQAADTKAYLANGIDNSGWLTTLISMLYGIVTITMITHGVFAAIVRANGVSYLPNSIRFRGVRRFFRYCFPFMSVATWAPEEGNQVIRFKGKVLMASDVWMNHWLYMLLSILDALANLRMTYVLFQMATWMLQFRSTFSTFLFLCSTLTRLTWLMCFFHSVLRWIIKLALRGMRSLRFVSPVFRERLEWYVDATALFMSYKIYSMLLFGILYCFLKLHKSTTLMKREAIPKVPVEGGYPNISIFWRSEIICDLVVFTPIVLLSGLALSTILLMTKYRHVPNNSVMRLMQRRYVFVGWDAFVVMEALGIDPFKPAAIDQEQQVALTSCSFGSLLQQLYASGPSGLVHMAGDYLFEEGGFTREPVLFHYSVKRAAIMGLYKKADASSQYTGAVSGAVSPSRSRPYAVSAAASMKDATASIKDTSRVFADDDERLNTQKNDVHRGVFDRTLRICSEGAVGRILLVDVDEPGKYMRNKTGSMMEFVARDALSFTSILEIKPLLNNDKKLRIS